LTIVLPSRFPIADFVLCGAVLAYVASQYRLLSLQLYVFPPDPRRRERAPKKSGRLFRWAPRVVQQRRSAQTASPWEIAGLLLAVPLWAGLAHLVWWVLPSPGEFLELPGWIVHGLLLTWLLGLALLVSAGILHYLGLRTVRPLEAKLFLHDTLWQETRREQRRLNRWTAWARLRAARAKEIL
ncbi:MAG: cytochrome P450, partial [Gemmataceae bacterium]|nr:cytochrome P450 [Gemmataceae bacterium]